MRAIFLFIDSAARFFLRDPRLFAKYVVVGGASAVIELTLFTLFYSAFSWPLLSANSCAIALTLLFHFNMQKRWTFRDGQSIKRQLPRYALMIAIASLMNTALIYWFVSLLKIPALPAKILQIGVVFVFTFSFSRAIVFTRRS